MNNVKPLINIQSILDEFDSKIKDFSEFAQEKKLLLYQIEDDGNFYITEKRPIIFKSFLEWEYEKKLNLFNNLFKEENKSQLSKILWKKPKGFTKKETIEKTAKEAIALQKNKNELCQAINKGTKEALSYCNRIASLYKNKNDKDKLLNAFYAIAIESQSENFDWDSDMLKPLVNAS